jgi:hypothetical protein
MNYTFLLHILEGAFVTLLLLMLVAAWRLLRPRN